MSFENAKENLKEFGKELGLEGLEFDENNTCILGIDDQFSLHLTYEPNSKRLYLYLSDFGLSWDVPGVGRPAQCRSPRTCRSVLRRGARVPRCCWPFPVLFPKHILNMQKHRNNYFLLISLSDKPVPSAL